MREELAGSGFEVITVAADGRGRAAIEEWVAAAGQTHPSLLDEQLRVADLYDVRNVPAAFWIDETGLIVRAGDPIYVSRPDPQTGERVRNEPYLAALRDWVDNGAKSTHLQDDRALEARRGELTLTDMEASASFQLGVHLARQGKAEAAQRHFQRAHELRPENWTYQRQAWSFAGADRETILRGIRDPAAPPFYPDLDL